MSNIRVKWDGLFFKAECWADTWLRISAVNASGVDNVSGRRWRGQKISQILPMYCTSKICFLGWSQQTECAKYWRETHITYLIIWLCRLSRVTLTSRRPFTCRGMSTSMVWSVATMWHSWSRTPWGNQQSSLSQEKRIFQVWNLESFKKKEIGIPCISYKSCGMIIWCLSYSTSYYCIFSCRFILMYPYELLTSSSPK